MLGRIAFAAIGCVVWGAAAAQDVAYLGKKVNGVWYHAVVANLNSQNVRVTGVINQTRGVSEPISAMLNRSQPTAAATGTFFNVQSAWPVGCIIVDGVPLFSGPRGSALAVDYFNSAVILDPPHGVFVDAASYRFLMRGGVRILNAGQMMIYPQAQQFKDSRVWGNARRVAVGLTANNKLIMMATNGSVQLRDVCAAMKEFGARDALVFDGGGSAAMYYRGQTLVSPQRRLTNLIAVYEAPGAAWAELVAPTVERTTATASWPSRFSAASTAEPMKPPAPVTSTRILLLLEILRLHLPTKRPGAAI